MLQLEEGRYQNHMEGERVGNPRNRRVLFITSYAPHGSGGSPNMLHNLLKYVPASSMAFLTTSRNLDPPINEPLRCPCYYYDSPPASLRLLETKAGPATLRRLYRILDAKLSGGLSIARQIVRIFDAGSSLLQQQGFDALVLTSDSGQSLIAGHLLSRKMHIPYSVILFDPYRGNEFGWFLDLVALLFEKRLLRGASKVIICGEKLLNVLERRVPREYVYLPNSVDIPLDPPHFDQTGSDTFKILYAGAVYWAQIDTIRSLVAATKDVPGIDFLICTPQKSLVAPGLEGAHVRQGFLPKKDLLRLQTEVDLLYLPLSFVRKYEKIVKLATASKLYEYMTSGRPILVHAPDYAFVTKYARERHFAHVITDTNPEVIRTGLLVLRRDRELRQRLARNAWQQALNHHDARKNSRILKDAILT